MKWFAAFDNAPAARKETLMKKLALAACALSAVAWSFAATANEPAPKPDTHCGDKGHGTHATEEHPCEHPKPAH